MIEINQINLAEYNYDLPPDRIAQYPVGERDLSQLLVYNGNEISSDIFRNITGYIPSDTLLVFNNTRVIRARILFAKETGSVIEVLCLEPLSPADYESSFSSTGPVEWKCIIGNLKKWKSGMIKTKFIYNGSQYELAAIKIKQEDDAWRIRFEWGSTAISFSEIIESKGLLPLPPYIAREAGADDFLRYQTVYSRIKGSVAAPTAGLHFTEKVLEGLRRNRIKTAEVTLHIGAGTFKPIKSGNISEHKMHTEHFFVTRETVSLLKQSLGRIIPVGTTSVRTLESLYWLGIKLMQEKENKEFTLGQWDAYRIDEKILPVRSLESIMSHMQENNISILNASTSIMIVPGYKFRMINGMITNFHQPGSTLLLLVSAWAGDDWKKIYRYALENKFRFLSYGDSSLMIGKRKNTL